MWYSGQGRVGFFGFEFLGLEILDPYGYINNFGSGSVRLHFGSDNSGLGKKRDPISNLIPEPKNRVGGLKFFTQADPNPNVPELDRNRKFSFYPIGKSITHLTRTRTGFTRIRTGYPYAQPYVYICSGNKKYPRVSGSVRVISGTHGYLKTEPDQVISRNRSRTGLVISSQVQFGSSGSGIMSGPTPTNEVKINNFSSEQFAQKKGA
uniref:Uncharacterized protein At2g04640 n=1 Tax=Arabidopsis thaliana TaxID=3702 RepID=Q9SJ95_ARATH|nr:hypothetical protein [Arabidopsis thaliana]